ncbi:MAG: PulJ/GspJ family protein [Clostridium sp.]|uniref:PulJ/GspJ family protein n=1 Tax=Clostridium sp. TaxID=1506 RepID=UPI003D6D3725
MYRVRKKTKGLTVLELILALAIGAMFTATFFQFFFIHQKALNSTAIKSKLQMDMQQSMDSFSKSAMEASGIFSLNSIDLSSVPVAQNLGEITFLVGNSDPAQEYSYRYRVVDKTLYYTPPGLAEKTVCSDVSYINITPIDSKTFAECSGIVIEIELIGADEKTTYNITNNIYFRNKN